MTATYSLKDDLGRLKYLTTDECVAAMAEAELLKPRQRMFFYTLYHTGGRIAEVLALRYGDVDLKDGCVSLVTLKRRNKAKVIRRRVPVPPTYLQMMDLVFEFSRGKPGKLLWPNTKRTAQYWIEGIFKRAGLDHHSTHSIRHTFAKRAVMKDIPPTLLKEWMGHSSIDTTSIYTQIGGDEEKELSKRMWE